MIYLTLYMQYKLYHNNKLHKELFFYGFNERILPSISLLSRPLWTGFLIDFTILFSPVEERAQHS